MGYSTREIDVKDAVIIASSKEVTEASDITYFGKIGQFSSRIEKAEIGDNGSVYFTMYNGDFVRME